MLSIAAITFESNVGFRNEYNQPRFMQHLTLSFRNASIHKKKHNFWKFRPTFRSNCILENMYLIAMM